MRASFLVALSILVGLLCASSAHAADPLYEDLWEGNEYVVHFQPDGSGAADGPWHTATFKYETKCSVPEIFEGSGVDGGPWQGKAGWYKEVDGKCAGSALGAANLTATDLNHLDLCTTDPFGISGEVCRAWQRVNPINAPIEVEPPQANSHSSFYAIVYDSQGVPHFVPANASGGSSQSTGDNGDSLLLAAEALTAGKQAQALFSPRAPCRKQMQKVLGDEVRWIEASLDAAAAGGSTSSQRQKMAAGLDSEASAGPSLGNCLAKSHYRGALSPAEARQAVGKLGQGSLPPGLVSALKRAGAHAGLLDVIRFTLRGAPPADLTGKLITSLKSKARAAALRDFAAVLSG